MWFNHWKICNDWSWCRDLKDVPDFALIVGNPGKLIGWVDMKGNRIQFQEDGFSKCGKYKKLDEQKVVFAD